MFDMNMQKNISQILNSTIQAHLTVGGTKLSQLQMIYKMQKIGFKQNISESGRALTKKIFGTGLKCINPQQSQKIFVNSPNLIAISLILLDISFKDGYIMKIIVEQLNQCLEQLEKMFKIHNPFQQFLINAESMQKIFAEILLKINSLRLIFNVADILRDYYIASELFSIFVRCLLVKANYQNSQNLQVRLQKTQNIVAILSDLFDLNIRSQRVNAIKKISTNKGENKNSQQSSRVYLFSDYNLFISTIDNKQFCCGKYYQNQTELLQCEKQLRRSTLQFIMKAKQAQQKQIHGENRDVIRTSQLSMDLGASLSGLTGSPQSDVPYFGSNIPTPQFGGLLQSNRFRKSIDFSTAINIVQDKIPKNVAIQQQEVNSPNSDQGPFKINQNTKIGTFDQMIKEYQEKRRVSELNKKKFQELKDYQFQDSDEDVSANIIPRSPPSTDQKKNQLKDSERKLTGKFNVLIPQQLLTKPNKRQPQKISYQYKINQNEQKFRIKIPQISNKQAQENNSEDFQPIPGSQQYNSRHQINELGNIQIKQSQYFNKNQEKVQNQLKFSLKKDSMRKYSVNQMVSKQEKKRQKNFVQYSNHFAKQEDLYDQTKSVKAVTINANNNYGDPYKNQSAAIWQNQNSKSEQNQTNRSKKKMQLSSNIVNFQVVGYQQSPKNKFIENIKRDLKHIYQKRQKKQSNNNDKSKPVFIQKMQNLRYSKSSKNSKSLKADKSHNAQEKKAQKYFKKHEPVKNYKTSKRKLMRYNSINQQVSKKLQQIVSPSSKRIQSKNFQLNNTPKNAKIGKFPQFLKHTKPNKQIYKSQQFNPKQLLFLNKKEFKIKKQEVGREAQQPKNQNMNFMKSQRLKTQPASQQILRRNMKSNQQKYSLTSPTNPITSSISTQNLYLKQKPIPRAPTNPQIQISYRAQKNQQIKRDTQAQMNFSKTKHTQSDSQLSSNFRDGQYRNLINYDNQSKKNWQYFGGLQGQIGVYHGYQAVTQNVNSVYDNRNYVHTPGPQFIKTSNTECNSYANRYQQASNIQSPQPKYFPIYSFQTKNYIQVKPQPQSQALSPPPTISLSLTPPMGLTQQKYNTTSSSTVFSKPQTQCLSPTSHYFFESVGDAFGRADFYGAGTK